MRPKVRLEEVLTGRMSECTTFSMLREQADRTIDLSQTDLIKEMGKRDQKLFAAELAWAHKLLNQDKKISADEAVERRAHLGQRL